MKGRTVKILLCKSFESGGRLCSLQLRKSLPKGERNMKILCIYTLLFISCEFSSGNARSNALTGLQSLGEQNKGQQSASGKPYCRDPHGIG